MKSLKAATAALLKEQSSLQSQLDKINVAVASLTGLKVDGRHKRRKFSAATRKKMSLSRKKYWVTKKSGT